MDKRVQVHLSPLETIQIKFSAENGIITRIDYKIIDFTQCDWNQKVTAFG